MRACRPKVFLSFAGSDRAMAKRLADDLEMYGVEAFYDARGIAFGGNVVLSINRAMAESHYYVLLWSANCVDRPWVDAEWAAAYAREINEGRSFLFIVRLDETPLPPLLAVRRYLDGVHAWPSVARDLAGTWLDDLDTGTGLLPTIRTALALPARPDGDPFGRGPLEGTGQGRWTGSQMDTASLGVRESKGSPICSCSGNS
jgi:hypothetical protein